MVSTLESIHIDPAISGSAGWDEWETVYKSVLQCDRLLPNSSGEAGSFHAALQRRRLDDILAIRYSSSAFCGELDVDSEAANQIGIFVSGFHRRERVLFRDGAQLENNTGQFSVYEHRNVAKFELVRNVEDSYITIPRATVEQTLGRTWKLPQPLWREDSPSMNLLRAVSLSLLSEDRELSSGEVSATRNVILELLGSLAYTDLPLSNSAVSAEMRTRIEGWIDQRLHLGDVSPASAAHAHGISLRSLHRVFSEDGQSYGSVVRSRRLARARRDIVSGVESVQLVSSRWGYSDASHFCREFKREFGMTPTQYRQQALRLAVPE